MKKIFRISLLALFIGVVACEDATDIIQESELNEEAAFRNVDDLQSGLNGVYAAYGPDSGTNGTGDILVFNALFTDNIKRGASSSGQGNQEYNFFIQPNTDFPVRIWGNRYSTINFANRVLAAWERIVPELESQADIDRANKIKGELLAMRALAHFDLLQYFTVDYENRGGLGIIIMDFVPEITDVFERNTVGECFDFINEDLIEAQDLIGPFAATGGDADVFYINENIIKAIRARVALFEGNYVLAETLADEMVNFYGLANPTLYSQMFSQNDNRHVNVVADDAQPFATGPIVENIFTLARVQGDNGVVSLWYANEASLNGSPFYEMSNQLYDLFSNNDVRRFVNVDEDSNPAANIILIGKYQGSAADQRVNHIKLIRSSEMLLIRAEAEARDGRLVEAAQSIKLLTDARFISSAPAQPVFATTNAALVKILEERRKELCFEGHRYLDIKRLGADVGIGINRDAEDCGSFSAPCDLPPTDYRFTMPIPRTEVNANPVITQNPNY